MECDAVTNFFHLLESQIQDFEWYYNVSIVTMVPWLTQTVSVSANTQHKIYRRRMLDNIFIKSNNVSLKKLLKKSSIS